MPRRTTGVEVNDFGTSWRDGTAFIAIVNCIQPGTIDTNAYRNVPNHVRLEAAFQAAESQLGIARLLDPEDVDVSKPDDKSIMTYVAQFLRSYPDADSKAKPVESQRSLEFQLYHEFVSWLNSKNSLLEELQGGRGHNLEYKDYLQLKNELAARTVTLEKLRAYVQSNILPTVTASTWHQIELSWQRLETQLRHWQWTLDTSLPGALGQIGEWLNNAEHILCSEDVPPVFDDEAANALKVKLDEHKQFFVELASMRQSFDEALVHQRENASEVSTEQLNDIAARFQVLPQRIAQRSCRLRFLEHKCCILAFLDLTDAKLKGWSVRYGTEEVILVMLEQYKAFVSRNKLFQEFERAFNEMLQVADEYKREIRLDKSELNEIDQFVYSSGERWRVLSTGLRCAQGILEEVLTYWKRWNAQCPVFELWLEQAQRKLDLSEDEKMEFFQDIGTWKTSYDALSEVAAFLVTSCETTVAWTVKQRIDAMASRWEMLFAKVKQYLQAGEILRHRRQYHQGMDTLKNWIAKADQLLTTVHIGNLEAMKEYGVELHAVCSTVDEMETLLKQVSRHLQSLMSDLSIDELTVMSGDLKRDKEALVRIRAQLSKRVQLFHQLRTQQESLDSGINECSQWLDEAESMLRDRSGHASETDLEATQKALDQHQTFFSRLISFQILLENKWKILENMLKSNPSSSAKDTESDVNYTRQKLTEVAARFACVAKEAAALEEHLGQGVRFWKNYQDKLRLTTLWLQRAEAHLVEKSGDLQQALETHQAFFDGVDDRLIDGLKGAAHDLQQWLPADRRLTVAAAIENSILHWRRIMAAEPVQRMKMQFRLDQEAFIRFAREIDRELVAQQQALTNNKTEHLLEQHLQYFAPGPVVREAEQCMERLESAVGFIHTKESPNPEIQAAFSSCRVEWDSMVKRAEDLRTRLETIPQKWDEYQVKLDDIITWMSAVDDSVNRVSDDATTLENYESLKREFQNVCHDVDSRREEMKWLVQRLDSMLSSKSEEEGVVAQQTLEAVIARYKNLVLVIDATMSKADLLSKCYACREEIRKVYDALQHIHGLVVQESLSVDLDALGVEIKKREAIVKKLDDQRVSIVSLLQRGKDLQHHPSSPTFLTQEIQRLDAMWTDTNVMANDKLKNLKGSERLWIYYQEQKVSIMMLLAKAEEELNRITPSVDPLQMSNELKARHEASVQLRQATEEMLHRLRSLLDGFSSLVAVPQRLRLQEEVLEIEKHIESMQTLNMSKIATLEDINTRLKFILSQVESVVGWLQPAQKQLHQLLSLNLSPEERLKRTNELQVELKKKLSTVEVVQKEARVVSGLLGTAQSSSTSLLLGVDVDNLYATVTQMSSELDRQSVTVFQDLVHWQEYSSQLADVKPWLDEAEMRVASSVQRPTTISEVEDLLDQARRFLEECNGLLTKLQSMSSHCQQMNHPSSARDEVDAQHTRWAGVHDAITQQLQRFQNLHSSWVLVLGKMDAIVDWLDSVESETQTLTKTLSTTVAALEKQLGQLKVWLQSSTNGYDMSFIQPNKF